MWAVCQRDVTALCFLPFNKNESLVIAKYGRRRFSLICLTVNTVPPEDFSANLKALMDFRGSAAIRSLTLLKLWGDRKEKLHKGRN
jgi:hypothetical protein